MRELRQVSKQEVAEIIASDVMVAIRYFGTKMVVFKKDDKYIFQKDNNRPIHKKDLIISDLNTKPIAVIESAKPYLTGLHDVTYNHKTDTTFMTYQISQGSAPVPAVRQKKLKFVPLSEYYTLLPAELIKAITLRHVNVCFDLLKVDKQNADVIIIRSISEPSKVFKIQNPATTNIKKTIPSEIFNLVAIEMVKKIDEKLIRQTVPTSTKPDEVFFDIIDRLFLYYITRSDFNLAEIEVYLPYYMKVDLKLKLPMLSDKVREVIWEDRKLFNVYVTLILLFSNKRQKGNNYMIGKIREKHALLYQAVHDICDKGIIEVNAPRFGEFINL